MDKNSLISKVISKISKKESDLVVDIPLKGFFTNCKVKELPPERLFKDFGKEKIQKELGVDKLDMSNCEIESFIEKVYFTIEHDYSNYLYLHIPPQEMKYIFTLKYFDEDNKEYKFEGEKNFKFKEKHSADLSKHMIAGELHLYDFYFDEKSEGFLKKFY